MHDAGEFITFHKPLLRILVLSCTVFLTALGTACSKESASNQAPDKGSPTASSNQNNQNAQVAPYAQANLKGDIERIALALSMAHDSAKLNKWQEAAAQLRGAKNEIDSALGRKPRLQDE